jgi:hypothetical protein
MQKHTETYKSMQIIKHHENHRKSQTNTKEHAKTCKNIQKHTKACKSENIMKITREQKTSTENKSRQMI